MPRLRQDVAYVADRLGATPEPADAGGCFDPDLCELLDVHRADTPHPDTDPEPIPPELAPIFSTLAAAAGLPDPTTTAPRG